MSSTESQTRMLKAPFLNPTGYDVLTFQFTREEPQEQALVDFALYFHGGGD